MTNNMNVINKLEAGIRGESLRQQAIASNIANMNTPGYRRLEVNFEQALSEAIKKDGSLDRNKLEIEFLQPEQTPINKHGSDVQFDHEVGEMVKNTLRHKAFVRLLKKQYQQYELAIKTR